MGAVGRRWLVHVALVAGGILLVAADAHALVYADGATLDSSVYGNVTKLSDSANGTAETDDNRAKFKQKGGTVSLFVLTYDFPTTSLSAGTNTAYLIVDGTPVSTVSARIVAVNGNTDYNSQALYIASTGTKAYQDHMFGLDFTLTSSLNVTSVTFLIVLANSVKAGDMELDAVALPEPATWLSFAAGILVLGAWTRRQVRRRPDPRT